MQAGLAECGRDASRVLGDLGEGEERPARHEPGATKLALEPTQPFLIGAERHDPEIGLVTEERGRDDLMAIGLALLDREFSGILVDLCRRSVEEVEDPPASRRLVVIAAPGALRGLRRLGGLEGRR